MDTASAGEPVFTLPSELPAMVPQIDWQRVSLDRFPVASVTVVPDSDLTLWLGSAHGFSLAGFQEVLSRLSRSTRAIAFAAEPPPFAPRASETAFWPDQWQSIFSAHGWVLVDAFRDRLCRLPEVPETIAQNLLLFVRPEWLEHHPEWRDYVRPAARRQVHPARLRRHRECPEFLPHLPTGGTLATCIADRWQGHPERATVSVVITFHNEGTLAHRTLNGLELECQAAHASGLEVEILCVLDNANAHTSDIVKGHPLVTRLGRCLEVRNGDCGCSRNHAFDVAKGDYFAVHDGDDLYSPSWLVRAHERCRQFALPVIVHPERILNFGMDKGMAMVFDTSRHDLTDLSPLTANRWIVTTFVPRVVYECLPYSRTDCALTGFGFEDWHWNCETLAAGLQHVTAPETALFYRRRPGSMVGQHSSRGALIRPTALAGSPHFAAAFSG